MSDMDEGWLDRIKWNSEGLVPAIAQDENTGKVLTQAWMNRESLMQTVTSGQAVYWSRSRKKLWKKGETSGHVQYVKKVTADCDLDAILLSVEQAGGIACHTGRNSCFHYVLDDKQWKVSESVIKDPKLIYKSTT